MNSQRKSGRAELPGIKGGLIQSAESHKYLGTVIVWKLNVYSPLMTLFSRAVVESALRFALVSWYNSLFTEKPKLTFSLK